MPESYKGPSQAEAEVQSLRNILLEDIRSVGWEKQVPAFHLNTKLAHLIGEGCLSLPTWRDHCERFVSCLPPVTAICGFRNVQVDPFAGLRRAFPSNRSGKISNAVEYVKQMWLVAKESASTSHTGLYHGNLVEILEHSGLLPTSTSTKFYLNVIGLKTSPAAALEELMNECEGEVLTGTGESTKMASGSVLYRQSPHRPVLWEQSEDGTFLSMEGYGCICRWRVLFDGLNAVVIQDPSATHTSVTNLGEHVRDACRRHFGEKTKCYEFYAPETWETISLPCEIVGAEGTVAGWSPVPVTSLPHLADWLRKNIGAARC